MYNMLRKTGHEPVCLRSLIQYQCKSILSRPATHIPDIVHPCDIQKLKENLASVENEQLLKSLKDLITVVDLRTRIFWPSIENSGCD